MWVLTAVYGLSPTNIATAIDMLLNHKDLTLQDSETVAAAAISFVRGKHWDSPICLMLELARKVGHLPLGTFDRGLARTDGTQKL